MVSIAHRTKTNHAKNWSQSLEVSDKLESCVKGRGLGHLVICLYYLAGCC